MIIRGTQKNAPLPTVGVEDCIAKTTSVGLPGVTTLQHCFYVGVIAQALWLRLPKNLQQMIPRSVITLSAVHDIGKISPGFIKKIYTFVLRNHPEYQMRLSPALQEIIVKDGYQDDHTLIGQAATEDVVGSEWAKVIRMHHGATDAPSVAQYHAHHETLGGQNWQILREKIISQLVGYFGPLPSPDSTEPTSEQLDLATGLTIFADWLGSDEQFLPCGQVPSLDQLEQHTNKILDEIGRRIPVPAKSLSFSKAFDLRKTDTPNEIQQAIVSAATKPGVFILEAPMGNGKTEAAFLAAWELIKRGEHHGIYFALPTRTTSNRIHDRIENFLRAAFMSPTQAGLLHSTAWMHVPECTSEQNDTGPRLHWCLPAKRGLLQPFGVGTIDHALLGTINVKHCSLRFLGLADKVVVLDEVHSYDMYTGSLLGTLVRKLASIGTTIIILSATLTRARRNSLLGIPENEDDFPPEPYPLLTVRHNGETETRTISTSAMPDRRIMLTHIEFDVDGVANEVIERAANGEMVLCVMNTIDKARTLYKRIKSSSTQNIRAERIGLLHSQFSASQRESLDLKWLKMFGKHGDRSSGAILVATQVVEQSVDIDADILFTMLAPTDMLLQRMGRLWRHERTDRKAVQPRVTVMYMPQQEGKSFKESLGAEAYVYSPYILWRTMCEWKKQDNISLPSGIRPILESTYSSQTESNEPLILLRELEERRQMLLSAANRATNKTMYNEIQDTKTRYSDTESLTILLLANNLKRVKRGITVFLYDGKTVTLSEPVLERTGSPRKTAKKAYAILLHRNTVSVRKRWTDSRSIAEGTKNVPYALTQYFFGKEILPLIVEEVSGNLTTLSGEETPWRYTRECGLFRSDNSEDRADNTLYITEDDNEFHEDFDW